MVVDKFWVMNKMIINRLYNHKKNLNKKCNFRVKAKIGLTLKKMNNKQIKNKLI